MDADTVDLVIVGAGPAGLAAACEARQSGLSVSLLDEQLTLGGQVYRSVDTASPQRRSVLGEDYAAAIRHFGRERICEVHLKDLDDLYGKGSMNFPAVRAALDDAGYRGWVGIEGLMMPLGIEQSLRYDLDYLRPIFPRMIP